MSIRFYNPPHVLLAQGDREGADIGGALSIVAMDNKHQLHVVGNIFSELSRGRFFKEVGLEDVFSDFTVKHHDDEAVVNDQELITRLVNAFNTIRKNGWIFYGIAGFEANTFEDALFVRLNPENVERLREAHRRIRTQRHFPVLIQDVTERSFIASMFHGNGYQYVHYPNDRDLYSIYEQTKNFIGWVAGIVCTAQEAANFYIISGNIHPLTQESEIKMNLITFEEAMGFIESEVIYPVSWFRINIGRNSLGSLEHWKEIQEDEGLKFAIKAYLQYVNTILKEQHEGRLE